MKSKHAKYLAIALIAGSIYGTGIVKPRTAGINSQTSNIQGKAKTYTRPASMETAIALPGLFEQILIILGLDPETPITQPLTTA